MWWTSSTLYYIIFSHYIITGAQCVTLSQSSLGSQTKWIAEHCWYTGRWHSRWHYLNLVCYTNTTHLTLFSFKWNCYVNHHAIPTSGLKWKSYTVFIDNSATWKGVILYFVLKRNYPASNIMLSLIMCLNVMHL